jgi:general stress protein 26
MCLLTRTANASGMTIAALRNMAPNESTTERFLEILKGFDTAILLTHSQDGTLHGRPMALAEIDDDGVLWFLTRIDSPKIQELEADPRAVVTCQSSSQFATLSGTCQISNNSRKLDEVWKESYKVWFEGKNDPKLVLLRVTPEWGEYWDNSGSKGIRYAFRAVAAYVQGKKMDDGANDPDQHAKVAL